MVILVNLLIIAILSMFRIFGVFNQNFAFTTTNPFFKDFAHLYAGFLFGAWRYAKDYYDDSNIIQYGDFYKWSFWFICVVELGSFLASKLF